MKRLFILPTVVLVVLCAVHTARAAPAWGVNCLSCHGQAQAGILDVVGEDAVDDPDESGTGVPDRGVLKVFKAFPGESKILMAEVVGLDTDDAYAVELKRLRFAGVENGGELEYGADCDWPEWEETAHYYTEPFIRYRWGSDPTGFTYEIIVGPNASYDYYDLVFAVAGKASDDGALFYAEEHFYLEVEVLPGDVDENGQVDLGDFSTFGTCLSGPDNVEPPPGCSQSEFEACDLDGDSDVDLDDFAVFAWYFTG